MCNKVVCVPGSRICQILKYGVLNARYFLYWHTLKALLRLKASELSGMIWYFNGLVAFVSISQRLYGRCSLSRVCYLFLASRRLLASYD